MWTKPAWAGGCIAQNIAGMGTSGTHWWSCLAGARIGFSQGIEII